MSLSIEEEKTKKHYDNLPFIEGGEKRRLWWKNKNEEFLPTDLIQGKCVVDVGCSRGEITRGLLERGASVYAVDISIESLKAFEGQENLTKVNASALKLPFNDGSFDFSQSIGVLHHTPSAQEGFKELARVTKPNGQIFIFLYSRYSLYHFLFLLMRPITKIFPLDWVPFKLLSFLSYATQIQQGYHLDQKQLKSLLGDAFWTPVATFHTHSEIKKWAKENQLTVTKQESYYLNCAYLYLFQKEGRASTDKGIFKASYDKQGDVYRCLD